MSKEKMTIRQQYAMAAMQGILSDIAFGKVSGEIVWPQKDIVNESFNMAEAMIRHEEDEAARKDWRGGKTISGSSL